MLVAIVLNHVIQWAMKMEGNTVFIITWALNYNVQNW
jgi:hypothetical protein